MTAPWPAGAARQAAEASKISSSRYAMAAWPGQRGLQSPRGGSACGVVRSSDTVCCWSLTVPGHQPAGAPDSVALT